MYRPKPTAPEKLEWRSTKAVPTGTGADASAPPMRRLRKNFLPGTHGNLSDLQYELLDGVEVTEIVDTLPAELSADLLAQSWGAPRGAGK